MIVDILQGLATFAAFGLVAVWCYVVAVCAHDAFAPDPEITPQPFVRTFAADKVRRRRAATHQTGAPA